MTGYVGEALTCNVTTMRDGRLEPPFQRHLAARSQRMGANTLTIATGHVIDALRFVAGRLRAGGEHGYDPGSGSGTRPIPSSFVETTSRRTTCGYPGELERGAAASVHVGAVPWAGTGFRMEIFGREGTLITTGSVSSQRGEMLRIQGAQGNHALGRPGDPPAVRVRAGRLPSGRSVQRRAVVRPVRGGDQDGRDRSPANVRYGRWPPSLPRYRQAGVRYGPGAAGRLIP